MRPLFFKPVFPQELLELACQFSKQSKEHLAIDDTTVGKQFLKFIEGVVDCYDSCSRHIVRGLPHEKNAYRKYRQQLQEAKINTFGEENSSKQSVF